MTPGTERRALIALFAMARAEPDTNVRLGRAGPPRR